MRYFARKGLEVVGVDNDLRRYFFGDAGSTEWNLQNLRQTVPGYHHFSEDIRSRVAMDRIFAKYGKSISLIVHTAAQPSHDWAAKEPHTDFSVNAMGTLNLLEACRKFAPEAVFLFTSTNKVYGDTPNLLPLREAATRWEVEASHRFSRGIDESMSIDQSTHSLFGISKAAADLMVQEYGRYFGMRTGCFRGGCLTGPAHSGTRLHGFLSYLVQCVLKGENYQVYGYKGKQVRDNIHSQDLIAAFDSFFESPRPGEVYNIGGGQFSNCSILEAFSLAEVITGKKAKYEILDTPRVGDHKWYISSLSKFQSHYPTWKPKWGIRDILQDIYQRNAERWVLKKTA